MTERAEFLGETNLAKGLNLQAVSFFDAFLVFNRSAGGTVEDQARPFLVRGPSGTGGRFRVVTFEWTGGIAPDVIKPPGKTWELSR